MRGIVAKNNGSEIEYKTVNKILAEFAGKANRNIEDSKKDIQSISKEKWIEERFYEFIDSIQDVIKKGEKYFINKTAFIYNIDEDSFRWTGNDWQTKFRIPFSEIIKLYTQGVNERKEIKDQINLVKRAKPQATYYFELLLKFKNFLPVKNIREFNS
ncbi:MAG: hypothetical protein IPG78_03905 [Ignavibacteria bacterium]|nr:hypothetical protein [Ignavibacteria bacterium]